MFLTTGLATGGAEMMLLKVCSRLDRLRFAPVVVSLGEKGVLGPRIEALGIPVHALGMRPHRLSLGGALFLRRLVRSVGPSVIQGWMYHGNLAASLAGGGKPVVWGIRQSLYDLRKERMLTRWVIRVGALMSRSARVIVYNSETSARQHEAFGFDPSLTRIIPNGFDTDVFVPDAGARASTRHELGLSENVVLIGLIGRYHPMKNHRLFLEAAALVGRECPAVRFLLAGAQTEARDPVVGALIAESGLGDRLLTLGERNDVPRLQAALDIGCSTSAWGEGFANVIGEAMSCGVPCVVTDVGDSARVVGDTGRVVPSGDAHALAAAWKDLIGLGRERRQALGMRARQRVIDKFSLGTIVKAYEDLYGTLSADRSV